jgi:hypothetical protein
MKLVALVALLLSGCDGTPSCKESVAHLYEQGCGLFSPVGGEDLSERDAVTQCAALDDAAEEANCTGKFDALVECWSTVEAIEVNGALSCDCRDELFALMLCQ